MAAKHIAGDAEATFAGADMSTKLKLMGVDVASIGDPHGNVPGSRSYQFTDERKQVYKKLVVSDCGKYLLGGVLVGDAAQPRLAQCLTELATLDAEDARFMDLVEIIDLIRQLALALDYSAYNSDVLDLLGLNANAADTLTITTNAAPILFDAGSGATVGLRYPRTGQDSAGRLVFLGFPLDAVPADSPPPNNRANLLGNILAFLAPGIGGVASVALDSDQFTIPSLVTVEVADVNLAGKGTAAATLASDTAPDGVPLKLVETVRRGLFRGYATLVQATNNPAPGQLRVSDGDVLWANHIDVPANIIVQATALVDTQAPIIQDVRVEPE